MKVALVFLTILYILGEVRVILESSELRIFDQSCSGK